MEIKRFNITEMICGVLNHSKLLLKQYEIQVSFSGKKPIYVWGDELSIEEVITNYVSNAIHYAKNEKHIQIKYELRDCILRVSVFNTGDPIPEKDCPYIFDKFYKVDKARTREYGGNGIGLSIVKAIMEKHQGNYGFLNHNNGVEFYFELEISDQ